MELLVAGDRDARDEPPATSVVLAPDPTFERVRATLHNAHSYLGILLSIARKPMHGQWNHSLHVSHAIIEPYSSLLSGSRQKQ